MSWLFSAALVEEFSEATSSDGAPSAPSNGNPIPQAYCAPDKMTAFSRLSRFGMTYAPLTENRGEELLTLYLAVFRAKTLVQQGGGAGITGSRSGLWGEMARVIREVRPRFCFVENSPMLTSRGLGVVLGDLAAMGFDAKWGVLGADSIGSCHHRERIWILAYSDSKRLESHREIRNTKTARGQEWGWASEQTSIPICPQVQHENAVGSARDINEVAARVDRLKAIGNGQVPLCAATAWQLLTGGMK